MARRTQVFQQVPWDGGIRNDVDAGVLGPNDLVQADNVVFATSGSRLKREGFDYLGTAIPAVSTRSSSGTTRTLVFASAIEVASPRDQVFVAGEKINVSGINASYNCTGGEVLTASGSTITYTFSGAASLTEGSTASTSAEVERAAKVIGVHDYWWYDVSGAAKVQYRMAFTNEGKLFRYDENGKRKEITKKTEAAQVQTVVCSAASDITGGDYFNLYAANTEARSDARYAVWFKKDGVGSAPVITGATTVEVTIAAADSAGTVATAVQTAIDALSEFSASVNSATVTITNAAVGDATAAADSTGSTATGFTFGITTSGKGPATAIDADPLLTECDMRTYNNRLFLTMNGVGNTPKVYYADDTDEWEDVYNAPDALYMGEFGGRLLMNSKTDKDRVYYCDPFDHNKWQGISDSGALRFSVGDGDPVGVNGLFPEFRTRLIVGKAGSIDKLDGPDVTADNIVGMTKGHGVVSHKAIVPIDFDDIIYWSPRGAHSLVATDTAGEFAAPMISDDIQGAFNTWSQSRLKYMQGAYVPALNSAFFTVAEEDDTQQTALWAFNVKRKKWYRWPGVNAQSVATTVDPSTNVKRLMIGTDDGRVALAQNGTYTDFGSSGISYRVKSGTIYVDGNPQTMKGFKKLSLLFRPKGDFSFTVYFKVDNQPVQPITFEQQADADLLGSTFILGTSLLGNASTLAPFTKDVQGVGRGCSIEVFQSGAESQVEIYGYMIEYEPLDIADETN